MKYSSSGPVAAAVTVRTQVGKPERQQTSGEECPHASSVVLVPFRLITWPNRTSAVSGVLAQRRCECQTRFACPQFRRRGSMPDAKQLFYESRCCLRCILM